MGGNTVMTDFSIELINGQILGDDSSFGSIEEIFFFFDVELSGGIYRNLRDLLIDIDRLNLKWLAVSSFEEKEGIFKFIPLSSVLQYLVK